jgi:hypothetical protein
MGAASNWREEWFCTHFKNGVVLASHPALVYWELASADPLHPLAHAVI